jgi:hypothetical protein
MAKLWVSFLSLRIRLTMGQMRRTLLIVLAAIIAAPLLNAASTDSGFGRTIQVRVKHARSMRGITATGSVRIGGDVVVDSYDSGDPAKSGVGGMYDPAKAGDAAIIATTSKVRYDFEIIGDAKIMGQVGTGAPDVLKPLSGNAAIGSRAFVLSGGNGLESGAFLRDDLNMSFPNVVLPLANPSALPAPTNGTVLGTNYTYVLKGGNYVLDNLLMSGGGVIVTSNSLLYVKDSVRLTASSFIKIMPGATLDLYVGIQMNLQGGSIINLNSKPETFNYFGLPTNTDVYLKGSAALCGNFYAPNARLEYAGTSAFFGASISRDVNLSGTFDYHYDEALTRKGFQYIPIGWKEL